MYMTKTWSERKERKKKGPTVCVWLVSGYFTISLPFSPSTRIRRLATRGDLCFSISIRCSKAWTNFCRKVRKRETLLLSNFTTFSPGFGDSRAPPPCIKNLAKRLNFFEYEWGGNGQKFGWIFIEMYKTKLYNIFTNLRFVTNPPTPLWWNFYYY